MQATKPGPSAASAPLLGDLLIVGAQVLQASQFIVEEKYLAKVCCHELLCCIASQVQSGAQVL